MSATRLTAPVVLSPIYLKNVPSGLTEMSVTLVRLTSIQRPAPPTPVVDPNTLARSAK
jgi:hypothetical protein